MKRPLLVHFIFHPNSDKSRALARFLHKFLNGDPVDPGLRVDTIFCPEEPDAAPPPKPESGRAERTFYVVFADAHLNTDDAWRAYVGDVFVGLDQTHDRMFPLQLSKNAWPLEERLNKANFARAHVVPENELETFLSRVLVTELCRYLVSNDQLSPGQPAPTRVFVSHTKLDVDKDPKVFEAFVEYLDAKKPVKSWVDSGDIGIGTNFEEAIEAGVEQTAMLCLLTDNYSSREYCRKEVLLAKRHDRPILVVDALKGAEKRGFPYLGNATVIRWADNPGEIIDTLLKEVLRNLVAELDLPRHRLHNDEVFTRPPELLTVLQRRRPRSRVLYPDPPLGLSEAREVELSGVCLTTPLQRIAESTRLRGRTIAVSLSESTDIGARGLDSVHLDAATLDICRYLLVTGASLAYGGHLGEKGYTDQLGNVVKAYNALEGVDPVDRIRNYRGWPLPRLTVEQRDDRSAVARIIETDRPADIDETMNSAFLAEPAFFSATTSPEHRFAWARGMTEMRERQADETAARVVLGGTFGPTEKVGEDGSRSVKWYFGLMPGVLEEVLISAKREQPVFLIGAFGGVAGLVFDLIEGVARPEATWEYQRECPDSVQLRELYQTKVIAFPDYSAISQELRSRGLKGLNPLLSEAEHRELATTLDTKRMIKLLMEGLSRLNPSA